MYIMIWHLQDLIRLVQEFNAEEIKNAFNNFSAYFEIIITITVWYLVNEILNQTLWTSRHYAPKLNKNQHRSLVSHDNSICNIKWADPNYYYLVINNNLMHYAKSSASGQERPVVDAPIQLPCKACPSNLYLRITIARDKYFSMVQQSGCFNLQKIKKLKSMEVENWYVVVKKITKQRWVWKETIYHTYVYKTCHNFFVKSWLLSQLVSIKKNNAPPKTKWKAK